MAVFHRQPLGEVSQNKPVAYGTKDKGSVTEEDQIRFNKLVVKGKELASQGKVKLALECNKQALAIYQSEKLLRRTEKMETYLRELGGEEDEDEDEDDGDDMVHMGDGYHLYRELFDKIYQHQREGVLWMWKMYKKGKGGILGDDMGLGKTIQVIAFLSGMFDSQTISTVLIILPVAVIVNWQREFDKWAPGIRVEDFHGMTKRERERSLAKVQRRGGIGLTSYGMVANMLNAEQFSKKDGREFVWDYIILDEGHKIKNPSNKCSKGIHSIPARRRMILTGTPIQNNLKEMWALFNWTHQGTLLGTARTFGMEFDNPIHRSRQKDATAGEKRLGEEMAVSLQKIIQPYFLRRTKAQVAKEKPKEGAIGGKVPKMPTLTRKNDLICWVYLSDVQLQIYEEFIQTEEVQELLNSTRSPLVKLTVLKKICDHPRLLNNRQCVQLGLQLDNGLSKHADVDDMDEETQKKCAADRIAHIDNDILIKESGKMVFLVELLDNIKAEGHRCLVFSQSRKILDIIQKIISDRGHKVARLDGTMRLLQEREDIIDKFSRDMSYSVFLLTTQVGGVGLTLTAADRVVIYDPSWNPATDAQAVDRAFRIGQDKNVVIYRLITCGSVEEKIYRRQIFKDSITRQTTGDSKNPYRYFTRDEIYALFVLDNPKQSSTQQQLQDMHTNQRKTDTSLDAHIAYLHTLEMYGISDHDLMFSQQDQAVEDSEEEGGHDYIQSRVAKAQQLLTLENEENENMTKQHGKYQAREVFKDEAPRRAPAPSRQPASNSYPHHFPQEVEEVDEEEEEEVLEKTMEDLKLVNSRSSTSPNYGARQQDQIIDLDTPSGERTARNSYLVEQDAAMANVDSEEETTADIDDESCAITIDDSEIQTPKRGLDQNTAIEMQSTPVDILNKRKREASSTSSTPRLVEDKQQRRRSVAAGLTPRKESGDFPHTPIKSPMVVTEELVFSPQIDGPVIQTKSLSDTTVDYEGFKSPFNIRANSTAIAEVEEGEEEDDDSDAEDSMILQRGAGKKTRKALIASDSEEEEGIEVNETADSMDSEEDPAESGHSPERSKRRRQIVEDSSEENSPAISRDRGSMNSSGLAISDSMIKSEAEPVRRRMDSSPETNSAVHKSLSFQEHPSQSEGGSGEEESIQSSSPRSSEVSSPRSSEVSSPHSSEKSEDHEEIMEETVEDRDDMEETVEDHEGMEEEVAEAEESRTESKDGNASVAEDAEVAGDEEEELEPEEEEEEEEETDEEESDEELTEEQQEQYISLMTRSRAEYKEGHLMEALRLALDGLDIYSGDERAKAYTLKVQQKLTKAQQK